jgi:hypothetical protein
VVHRVRGENLERSVNRFACEPRSSGTVHLLAGTGASGRPVFENVPADRTAPDEWTLTASPGMAMGAGAGDVVRVRPDVGFDVLTRAGNIAVHAAGPADDTTPLNWWK